MAVTGKTQKYQNLSNNIKGYGTEKKMLHSDTVTQIFNTFGYHPSQADTLYWSNQPEDSKTKLINDLKKRHDEQEQIQKEQAIKKQGPNHLTDAQITKLYSEYGLPIPKNGTDFNNIKNTMPDDEEKFRTILDTKRQEANQMLKIKGQNTINTIKQNVKAGVQQPNYMERNNQYSGQGGPSDGTTGTAGGTSHFMPSRYNVIKFSGGANEPAGTDSSTLWLLDSQTKQVHPFLSMAGFTQLFGANTQSALNKVVTLDPNMFLPNGDLGSQGYTLLGANYGIDDNGKIPDVPTNAQNIQSLYGQTQNDQSVNTAYTALDGYLNLLKTTPGSGIGGDTINNILNDPTKVSKYISALAYGGYNLNDVYKDIKSQELSGQGDQSMKNVNIIDPTLSKNDYMNTNNGKISQGFANINPPVSIGGVNSSVLNSPITQLPDEAFKILVPVLDPNSTEFKNQMDQIQSAFHDILTDQINASTAAEKSQADSKYQNYRDYIAQNYGIRISMDATQGWQQLQSIASQAENNGISGSGIQAGQTASELNDIRTIDKRWRERIVNDQETNAASTAQATASPADVQRMNAEDQAKGLAKEQWRSYRWGLMPSDQALSQLDIASLQKKYPNSTPEELNNMRSQILDENGNYRSTLYQKQADSIYQTKYGNTMSQALNPSGQMTQNSATGLFDSSSKEGTVGPENVEKSTEIYNQNLQKENKASAPYTQTDPSQPFSGLGTGTAPAKTDTNSSTPTNNVNTSYNTKNDINTTMFGNSGSGSFINPPASTPTANVTTPKVTIPNVSGLTKINDPSQLKNYTENDIVRNGADIYLKSGVKPYAQ